MERVFGDFPWVLRTQLPELTSERERVKAIVLSEFETWTPAEQQYSFPIGSKDDFFERLYEGFFKVCAGTFEPFTLHRESQRKCFAYVQNHVRGTSVWHDHLATSTINGVYYLAAPGGAGELWFLFREHLLKATPQEGWLYLFPRWLLHKPVAQQSPFFRISLNVELITNECPIALDGGARW